MTSLLFDETFLRKLEQLSLIARRVRRGQFRGEQRSTRRGQSIEFADYRNYVRGDDLRALDWNIFARLERPFIKLFEEEIDQTVHILLDASGSMAFPPDDADTQKWHYARRLAAALGYIALANNDRLHVTVLRGQTLSPWGPYRHRRRVHQLLEFLENAPADGETTLSAAFMQYALRFKRPGLLFILSDFLTPEDYQPGISALQQRGHELTILHLLSPAEIDPAPVGDVQLVDAETGAKQDVTLNTALTALYRREFEVWQGELASFCHRRRINYGLISTDQPFESLLLHYFRHRGWAR